MVEPISEFGGKKEQLTFDYPLMSPVSSRIRYLISYKLVIILCEKWWIKIGLINKVWQYSKTINFCLMPNRACHKRFQKKVITINRRIKWLSIHGHLFEWIVSRIVSNKQTKCNHYMYKINNNKKKRERERERYKHCIPEKRTFGQLPAQTVILLRTQTDWMCFLHHLIIIIIIIECSMYSDNNLFIFNDFNATMQLKFMWIGHFPKNVLICCCVDMIVRPSDNNNVRPRRTVHVFFLFFLISTIHEYIVKDLLRTLDAYCTWTRWLSPLLKSILFKVNDLHNTKWFNTRVELLLLQFIHQFVDQKWIIIIIKKMTFFSYSESQLKCECLAYQNT